MREGGSERGREREGGRERIIIIKQAKQFKRLK